MLKATDVARVTQEVQRVFNEEPVIHVKLHGSVVLYEVMIHAPACSNVGRGYSLQDALQQLKERNHK